MSMARGFINLASQFIILTLLSSFSTILVAESNREFARTIDRKLFGLKKEKLSHLRLYWHDVLSSSNPTSVQVVPSPLNSTKADFGFINMMDNPLTLGPEMSSKLVGRAQGFYAQASQTEIGFLMVMNFAFIEGKYNGSTITVLGRDLISSEVREMPVVGGSGLFRFARGYAQLTTNRFNPTTKDATAEYNIYVLHY